MNAIVPDIDTLKRVVKINASIPAESVSAYIDDALEIYIEPQVGSAIVEIALTGTDPALNEKMLRCLGPLAIMLATNELGISIGDAGITVSNEQGKRSPANEAKIAAAKESFGYRGMLALDRLLSYLSKSPDMYPGYAAYLKESTDQMPCFIKSAQEYQDTGMVEIGYSTITYRIMLPTIRQLQERNVLEMLGEKLYTAFLEGYTVGKLDAKQTILLSYVIRYLANKSAELYTSKSTIEKCVLNESPHFKPIIRPVCQDLQEPGNFFADQAAYYAGKIHDYITENAAGLGVLAADSAIVFNAKEKHLFSSIL